MYLQNPFSGDKHENGVTYGNFRTATAQIQQIDKIIYYLSTAMDHYATEKPPGYKQHIVNLKEIIGIHRASKEVHMWTCKMYEN